MSQMTILLNGGMIPHRKTLHAIELLGTKVAPLVRKELAPWLNRWVPLVRPGNNPLQVSSPSSHGADYRLSLSPTAEYRDYGPT